MKRRDTPGYRYLANNAYLQKFHVWEYTKFRHICDIQRIRTEPSAISELEFVLNSILLKAHVSNGYHKGFCKTICYGHYGDNNQKIHYPIKVRVVSNNFPKIKFRIYLTWWLVLTISIILPEWWYHLYIWIWGNLWYFRISQIFKGVVLYRSVYHHLPSFLIMFD